jgi:hypothetical protein
VFRGNSPSMSGRPAEATPGNNDGPSARVEPKSGKGVKRFSASVCMRGHYSDRLLELSRRTGGQGEKFCSECGAPVIEACPQCKARLFGSYEGVPANEPEKFCFNCGAPYPWADRDALIMQLRNQLEFEPGLDDADRLELIEQLAVLSRPDEDEKRRVRAGERVKQLAPKGWAVAQPILTSLLSAELRMKLGLPPG